VKVHQYFYGPLKSGIDYEDTPELKHVLDEDTIRELYCQRGSKTRRVENEQFFQTPKGLVLGVTRIDPVHAPDGRSSTVNRSVFITVSDIISYLKTVLDKPATFPLQTVTIKE